MARTFSLPANNYAAGTYGPFPVDGFTSGDVDSLIAEISRTAVEDWPDVALLFTVTLTWDSGGGASATFSGRPKNRNGTDKMLVSLTVGVPRDAAGPRDVVSGTIMVQAHAPCRAAVQLRAQAAI